jgi:hypothetical protein
MDVLDPRRPFLPPGDGHDSQPQVFTSNYGKCGNSVYSPSLTPSRGAGLSFATDFKESVMAYAHGLHIIETQLKV